MLQAGSRVVDHLLHEAVPLAGDLGDVELAGRDQGVDGGALADGADDDDRGVFGGGLGAGELGEIGLEISDGAQRARVVGDVGLDPGGLAGADQGEGARGDGCGDGGGFGGAGGGRDEQSDGGGERGGEDQGRYRRPDPSVPLSPAKAGVQIEPTNPFVFHSARRRVTPKGFR